MRLRFTKAFRILGISLAATLVLLVATSAVITLFYEQAVVRYLKKYLDEHLLTQISMEDIRFRVLRNFPHATVEISQAVMLSGDNFSPAGFSGDYADTLLKAGKISFQFDLFKLVRRNYELRKIEVEDGFVNILFDRRGHHNLTVWKADSGSGSYTVNLKSVSASDMSVRYTDLRSGIAITTRTPKTIFRGTYRDKLLSGDARGSFSAAMLTVDGKPWLNHALVDVEMKLVYSHERFRIREGIVRVNKALIGVSGEYKSGKRGTIDLALDVPRFGLDELMSLLPVNTDSLFRDFRFTGKGSLKASLKGPVSDPDHLQIESAFRLEDCTARNQATRGEIRHISMNGTISGTQARNFRLHLGQFTSTIGKGSVKGSLEIRNLHELNLDARIESSLDLKAIRQFLDPDTVEMVSGMVQANFEAGGQLAGLQKDSAARYVKLIRSGSFVFQQAGIKLKNSPVQIGKINGKATLNRKLFLDSLSLSVNENNVLLSGTVENLNDYLLNRGILYSDLSIQAGKFSINSFLRGAGTTKGSTGKSFFPDRMNLKARLQAETFEAALFAARDLSLSLTLAGDSLYIPSFSLKFPDGQITGNALVSEDRKHVLTITCNSVSKQINIRQLFTAFNNFAQNFIIDKNVKGSLSGTIQFTAQWDSALTFLSNTLKARAVLEVTNGELVQFEPMLKLSKYISVDELRLIRFKTMKNEIFVNDRQVILPEMDIHSSAFNISVSGSHTFDNVFDYRMRVLLSEVLFKKARNKRTDMEEYLVEEDGQRTTIPLIIAGTPDNFDVKLDRRRAFDLSPKNAGQTGPAAAPDKNQFRIEWEEDRPRAGETKPVPENTDDFTIEWDE